jgi:D-sedoheptulose 7-phosphate isomerase
MSMLEQRIQQQFFDSADLKYAAAEVLSKPIADAVQRAVGCITAGGKILSCGNGGSAGDAQHFAAEFVGASNASGPASAAIALTTDSSILTAIGNDYDFNSIFSKQVQALGVPGRRAAGDQHQRQFGQRAGRCRGARAKEMTVIALTGHKGGKLRELLQETDVMICVPHDRTARIQEVHLLVLIACATRSTCNCSANRKNT